MNRNDDTFCDSSLGKKFSGKHEFSHKPTEAWKKRGAEFPALPSPVARRWTT